MKKRAISNVLSMAQKAGAVVSGDFMVEKTIRKRKGAPLLLLASDTASNNAEKYIYLSETYSIPTCSVFTKEELGKAIGKEQRVVALVTDSGFAQAVLKIISST